MNTKLHREIDAFYQGVARYRLVLISANGKACFAYLPVDAHNRPAPMDFESLARVFGFRPGECVAFY
jgi:hypothetical protein